MACENQAKVNYAMSVRNMLYDSLSYDGQIQRMWTKNVEKMSTAEFLSKFRKDDRLIPVLTLVFYYDVDQWDGSKDLYGMLQCGSGWEIQNDLQIYSTQQYLMESR